MDVYERVDAIYARQSVDKKDSISIESQVERCEKEVHGTQHLVYIDKGFSGSSTKRPDFTRMMEDVKKCKIKRVITYKLDRISRSVLDFQKLIIFFEEHNVEFISVTEAFDTQSPMGRAMRNIMSVFAQLERETIQQRVTDSYYALAEKGMFLGGRIPYAYRLEKTVWNGRNTSRYEVDAGEAGVLMQMYRIFYEPTTTLGDVRRYLDSVDELLLSNRIWSTARISEVLRNPVYVKADADVFTFFKVQGTNIKNPVEDFIGENGCYLYRGRDNKDCRKRYDFHNRDLVIAPHQGIIDSKIWLGCIKKLMCNTQKATPTAKNSWLVGKVKCGHCGYAATIRKSKRKQGYVRYFVCSGRGCVPPCQGIGRTIRAEELEEYMLQAVKNKLAQFAVLSLGEDAAANKNLKSINENKILMAKLEQDIENLIDKVALASETVMEHINQRVEELNQKRKALAMQNYDLEQGQNLSQVSVITNHVDKWPEISFEDKRKVINLLIDKIILQDDTIEIIWKF